MESFVPTLGILKREGFTHETRGTSQNGADYSGFINASEVWQATRLVCKWKESGLMQVAHKERGDKEDEWKFKGFGFFTDEAHFLKLLANPNGIQNENKAF
jgi:hypothetical protein